MATVERDSFGTWAVIGDDGVTLGRYADKNDAQNRLRDLQDENSIRMAAATLGARGGAVGGLSTSPAKAAASRTNGKLGGRPQIIKSFDSYPDGGWFWTLADGTEYATNKNHEGLWQIQEHPYERKQKIGTCDFHLSRNRSTAMAQVRKYFRASVTDNLRLLEIDERIANDPDAASKMHDDYEVEDE